MTGSMIPGQHPDPMRNPSFRAEQAGEFSSLPLLRKVGLRREKSLFAFAGFIADLLLRRSKLSVLLCSGLLVFTFVLNAQAPVAVPIPKEPHHHLVLENSYVRVFRVSIPAHDATLLHQHDVPYVYVSLGPADVINAVQGKPEARIVMADGQVGYSRGGFAHIARTDAGSSFDNVTIELLHPQGEPRNLCEKIIDGPLNNCQSSGSGTVPEDSPLRAFVRATGPKKLFETEEVFVTSHSAPIEQHYSESGPPAARLLVVEDNSDLRVVLAGEPSKSLHSGEVFWLEAGKQWAIITPGGHEATRFLLIRFKDSAVSAAR